MIHNICYILSLLKGGEFTLGGEICRKSRDRSKQYLIKMDSGNSFYDNGVACVRCTKEYKVLFNDLDEAKRILQGYDEDMVLGYLKTIKKRCERKVEYRTNQE